MKILSLFFLFSISACEKVNEFGDQFNELAEGIRAFDESENIGFLGGAASDEPLATLAGRDVLEAGGNAVDAATAIYFTLAVTLPSSASLGGGGVCIVHDAQSNVTLTLDFKTKASQDKPILSKRANAVPGNVAGFFALHSRYGRLPWAQLVAPAEGLARFGFKMSRALSHDLKKIGNAFFKQPEASKIFGDSVHGGVLVEGDILRQIKLADVIGKIRKRGSSALYRQPGAEFFAAAISSGGGFLTVSDLINYKPTWRVPIRVPLGDISVHFSPPPAAGGAVAAEIFSMVLGKLLENDTAINAQPHLLVETFVRAYSDRNQWMQTDGTININPQDLVSKKRINSLMASYNPDIYVPSASTDLKPPKIQEDTSGTTFAVMDEDGMAVSCALSMNSLFGNGLIAENTGILMASPSTDGRGAISLGPMLAVDHYSNDFFFAGAASGGPTAPTALVSVALSNVVDILSLENSIHAKRIHNSGNPDTVYFERGYDKKAIDELIKKGHQVAEAEALGRVNAVGCTEGLIYDSKSCEARTDPRGFGLAVKIDN